MALQPTVVAGALILLGLAYSLTHRRCGPRLPGPPGIPVFGNLFQLPQQHLATYFRSLVEKYGNLVYLDIVGIPILLIGNMSLAKEIMDKRSSKFSSRPVMPFFRDDVDPECIYWAVNAREGEYVLARRLTAGVMSSVRAGVTEPLQHFETLLTVHHLLEDGTDWFANIERLAISTTMTAAFGAHFPIGNENNLIEAKFLAREISFLVNVTASITNFLPFLTWIPVPLPSRKRAEVFRKRQKEFFDTLTREAVAGKACGMNTWVAQFASMEGDQSHLTLQFITAAFETTATTLKIAILSFLMHPEKVSKAQKELDGVVGPDRLPTFADRPKLPYIEALLREVLRWRPALRIGVPHQSSADDVLEYNGHQYFLPKGSIVFALPWAIEHNSNSFSDSDNFQPERFLDNSGELLPNYETSAFGFGRRVCPGIPFAERSVWIAIALLLWTFNIEKAKDPQSGDFLQYSAGDEAFTGDISNSPYKFPALFTPRSSKHEEVARQEWDWCEKDLNTILPASTT